MVPIFTLDKLVASDQLPIPEILKIDVQGYELEVLKGAEHLLGKTEIIILEASLFEFMPNQPIFQELVKYMDQKEYFVYDFAGFLNRPSDMALGQLDVCFVKKDSFLRASKGW